MVDATAIPEAPAREYLRANEIGPLFDGLSRDDKLKLYAVEAMLRRGTGFGKTELLREAICRTLDGDRKCPRNVVFMAFLIMTMKSIASHARKEAGRTVAMAECEPASLNATDVPTAQSPEDDLIIASMLREIYGRLKGDDEATLVLMGWEDELRGQDLRIATGLDQSALDYAIRRIRACARKLYPDGLIT